MIPIFHATAFVTEESFSGNPAAVCLLEEAADDSWMQGVARDMNLSETAFVRQTDSGRYALRWFTPTVEVDLCGHATLASAHVLWTETSAEGPLTFDTRSGALGAERINNDQVALDFPSTPTPKWEPPEGMFAALGAEGPVFRSRFDYMVELEDAEAVKAVVPNFNGLRELGVRGVIVTARGNDVDFVSRFFAPGAGVDEDPVTGSAHCALAPHWAEKLGRTTLSARQLSSRGGRLDVELRGDRVTLKGRARTHLRGELIVRQQAS